MKKSTNAGQGVGKREPSYTVGGNVLNKLVAATMVNSNGSFLEN